MFSSNPSFSAASAPSLGFEATSYNLGAAAASAPSFGFGATFGSAPSLGFEATSYNLGAAAASAPSLGFEATSYNPIAAPLDFDTPFRLGPASSTAAPSMVWSASRSFGDSTTTTGLFGASSSRAASTTGGLFGSSLGASSNLYGTPYPGFVPMPGITGSFSLSAMTTPAASVAPTSSAAMAAAFSASTAASPRFGAASSAAASTSSAIPSFSPTPAASSAWSQSTTVAPSLGLASSTSALSTPVATATTAQTASLFTPGSSSGTTSTTSATLVPTPKLLSEITGETVEEEWNSELQERTGKFRKQANAVAEWDKRILQNRDILLKLEGPVLKEWSDERIEAVVSLPESISRLEGEGNEVVQLEADLPCVEDNSPRQGYVQEQTFVGDVGGSSITIVAGVGPQVSDTKQEVGASSDAPLMLKLEPNVTPPLDEFEDLFLGLREPFNRLCRLVHQRQPESFRNALQAPPSVLVMAMQQLGRMLTLLSYRPLCGFTIEELEFFISSLAFLENAHLNLEWLQSGLKQGLRWLQVAPLRNQLAKIDNQILEHQVALAKLQAERDRVANQLDDLANCPCDAEIGYLSVLL